jgi:small subunit ribosomal protein S1
MPSPDNASPNEGTASTDTQASPEASAVESPLPAAPPAAPPEAPISPRAETSPPPVGDATPTEAAASPGDAALPDPAPGAAPGAPTKRRRRRRKKGGHGAAAAPAQDDAIGENAQAEAAEPAADGASPPKDGGAPAKAGGRPGKREGKGHAKKPADKPREKREPRERPAFGLGDVVFGKIIEITDDAILVDLSGKAKGIFDRAEMLLPDEPPDPPAPEPAPALAKEGVTEARKPDPVEGEPGAATPEPSEPAVVAATDAEAVPPTVTSGGVERKQPSRRIIVAPGALAIDAAPAPAPEPAPEAEPETPVAEALPDDGAPAPAEAAGASSPEAPAEAPPHRPAPYAPPIVLELGAHFVGLVHNDGARGGLIVLTRHPRRASQAKGMVAQALRDKTLIKGLVTGTVKGGVEVDVDGLRAFAPGSHMDLRLGTNLARFIGQRLEFAVTQYGKRGRDVVLSRKAFLEAEARTAREAALAKLTVGAVVDGVVRSVVAFGAFVDVGGVEGLVGLPEMSHNRADKPSDVFKVGETASVKIMRIDDKGKVWLSRKAATVDPRLEAFKKYGVGTRHSAKIVRLQPFGAFLELEPGIDGLIHTADLSIKHIEHPSDVVKVGDTMDVVVATVDGANQKIALHPAPAGAAADEAPQRVQIHKPLKVVVVAVEAGGLVVRVLGATGRHARGYITSAATGTPRGTELRKPFPVGTQIDAKVVEIDAKRGEIKLSIKALREDTERSAYQQYRQQVTREAKFGTFGDLLAKKGLVSKE